jgi:hypothetical protein
MKCPHCLVSFHEGWNSADTGQDGEYLIRTWWTNCPACGRLTLMFVASQASNGIEMHRWMVHPKVVARSPLDEVIPDAFREDFREATVVLADSPKASAALSRRCLQAILRKQGFSQHKLFDQIDAAMPSLPGYVADPLHYVRDLGNIAAHETTNKATGEIVDVEPGEADALLGVLEDLFDHYYVKPEQVRLRAEALAARKNSQPIDPNDSA